jgi:thioredoxin 1
MKHIAIVIIAGICLCLLPAAWGTGAPVPAEVPVKGMITMIDLGAHSCIPCKLMAPIIEKLKKEYDGRAAIVFIDVWKDPNQTQKYGLKAIPTQIFFNEKGEEVYRHLGFMNEAAIVEQLKKMGVN